MSSSLVEDAGLSSQEPGFKSRQRYQDLPFRNTPWAKAAEPTGGGNKFRGRLVLMGKHPACTGKLGVRFRHCPPSSNRHEARRCRKPRGSLNKPCINFLFSARPMARTHA